MQQSLEFATTEWVDWFNTRRVHSALGYITPDEFEAVYCAQPSTLQPELSLARSGKKPEAVYSEVA